MKHLAILPIFFAFLISCNKTANNDESPEFKKVVNLDSLEQTDFILNFSEKFDHDKNVIYSSTMGVAWDEVKNVLEEKLNKKLKSIESEQIELLDKSHFHQNVLDSDEYEKEIKYTEESVAVRTMFHFNLDYIEEFENKPYQKQFKNDTVAFFGCEGKHKALNLIYYKDDDDFSVQLLTKDENHEIILMKTDFKRLRTFKDIHDRYLRYKKKYDEVFIRKIDLLRIPKINFHIENDFEEIVNSKIFFNNGENWIFTKIYQRNAFKLNEKGVIVESESKMEMKEEIPEIQPKKLIFDDNFVVLLKKKGAQYPYFMVYVNNAEILEHAK